MVRHTGYLSLGRPDGPATAVTRPYVVTMVGGGSDGELVCGRAAQAQAPAGHHHLVVTGPQMPEAARRRIAAAAAPRTEVIAQVPDGLSVLRGAAAVVSMAGYNTVSEIMSTDVPSLLVPREVPRREQAIRAEALSRVGAMETVSAPGSAKRSIPLVRPVHKRDCCCRPATCRRWRQPWPRSPARGSTVAGWLRST